MNLMQQPNQTASLIEEELYYVPQYTWLPSGQSKADKLRALSVEQRRQWFSSLSQTEKEYLPFYWSFWARPKQLPPPSNVVSDPLGWQFWIILAGRSFGKALAIDTPILTTQGWKTMGTLNIGDSVFAPDGKPTKITFATDIMYDHVCYDVHFSDGSIITADAEHLWFTWDKSSRKAQRRAANPVSLPSIKTTQQIKDSLKVGKEFNHSIAVTDPIEFSEQDLPIDPYFLGCWLGDGDVRGAYLTGEDFFIFDEMKKLGYNVGSIKKDKRSNALCATIGSEPMKNRKNCLTVKLKTLGVLNNKHIPQNYLFGSKEQRLALLQGLMDTDGTISKLGHSCFDNTNKLIVEGVKWLAESLGIKCSQIHSRIPKCNGKDGQLCYRVWFTTDKPIFRLPRKLNRIRKTPNRNDHRVIIDIKERPSIPVRCIQVDHPSHLYLAGKELIPTHNTRLAAEYLRYRIENGLSKRIALIGPTYQDVIKTMLKGESGLLSIFPPKSQIKARLIRKDNIPMVTFTNGKETIAEAYIYTGEEPERLRGPQHDFAWVDEVAAFRYLQEVWELFIAGLRLGESKAIFTTTPKSKLLSIKGFLDSPRAVITFGESKENANNVSKGFMDSVLAVYEGSSREDEELKGKIRLDESGALFKQAWLIRNRVTSLPLETVNVRNPVNGHLSPSQIPAIQKYVIAIDPSGSDKKTACECGIVLVALGKDGNAYLIKDLSKRDVPENWARIALQAAYEYNAEIAFEKNYGGDLVPTVISLMAKNMNKQIPILVPLQASKDKHSRAVPVSALVSKNKVKFVGHFDDLERQLTTWTPEDTKSPDRLDAFVWAITHLLVKLEPARGIIQQPLMNF